MAGLLSMSGADRSAWLAEQGQKVGGLLDYYLGPQLAPRVKGLLSMAGEFSDAADWRDYYTMGGDAANAAASGDWGGFARSAPLAAASGIAAAIPGLSLGPLDNVARAAEDGRKSIIAYHGSPHDFDRFDMAHIGKGEGAQAYGHGLYFAENEGVARRYRDDLTMADGSPQRTAAKVLRLYGGDVKRAEEHFARAVDQAFAAGDMAGAKTSLASKAALAAPDRLPSPDGRLYQVRIDADPDAFLDWDAPLSAQPERVRDALEPRLREYLGPAYDGQIGNFERKTGGQVVEDMLMPRGPASVEGRVRETERLVDAGIPGIKYLDQGSRGAGDGTRNYVVFDDRLITILKKYGIGAAMAGGAYMLTPQEYALAEQALGPTTQGMDQQGQPVGLLSPGYAE